MELSASLQDYLEGILFVQQEKGRARVADLAGFLNVKKPSVVKSLLKLKELGLIEQEPYQAIQLTSSGRALALKISKRHNVLKDFFFQVLMIDEKTADRDACRIEHVISSKTFERLTQFVEKHKKAS
ncbi:MAG: metal-dependent transcriptional regulator [Candidatus Omnitrophota bacterium]